MDKCVENFDELASQVREEIRKKIDPKYSDDDIVFEVTNNEDYPKEDIPKSSEWAEKRNKR